MVWSNRAKSFSIFSFSGMLLVSLLAAAVVALLVALLWPTSYTATSSFFVSTRSELLTALGPQKSGASATAGAAEVLKPTQDRLAAILASRLLRSQLVQEFQLETRLNVDAAEAQAALAGMVQVAPIGEEGFTITVTCRGYSRPRASLGHGLTRPEARRLSAALANSYLKTVQNYITTTTVDEARRNREFLQTALAQVENKLGQTEKALQAIQRGYDLTDPQNKISLLTDQLKTLEQSRAQALAEVRADQASLNKAQAHLSRTDATAIASVVQTRNPVISQLEQQIAQLRVDLATQEAMGKTRQNRDVAQIVASLQGAQEALKQVSEEIQTSSTRQANPAYDKIYSQVVDLQVSLAGAKARAAKVAELLAAAEAQLQRLPPVAQRYATLHEDLQVQSQTRATLKQALAVALIQERQSKQAGEFLVLDKAVEPPDLHHPPVLLSALAVFVLLLIALGMMALNRSLFGP